MSVRPWIGQRKSATFDDALLRPRIEEINEAARFFADPRPAVDFGPSRRRRRTMLASLSKHVSFLRAAPRVENRFCAQRRQRQEMMHVIVVAIVATADDSSTSSLIVTTVLGSGSPILVRDRAAARLMMPPRTPCGQASDCRMISRPTRRIYSIRIDPHASQRVLAHRSPISPSVVRIFDGFPVRRYSPTDEMRSSTLSDTKTETARARRSAPKTTTRVYAFNGRSAIILERGILHPSFLDLRRRSVIRAYRSRFGVSRKSLLFLSDRGYAR